MPVALHQVLPVFTAGDAIGTAVRRMRESLRRLGYRSEVFADLIDRRLAAEARPAGELKTALQPGDGVVYHLSIGSRLAALVAGSQARLVVVYHNLTPSSFFSGVSAEVSLRLEQGRRDLDRLARRADLVIGDSEFNLVEARAAGAVHAAVVPPGVDLERLRPRPSVPASPAVVLFVGRIAPNKRPDRLVRALAALRAGALPGSA